MKFAFEIEFKDTEIRVAGLARNLSNLDFELEESIKLGVNNPKKITVRIKDESGLELSKICIERVINLEEQKALLLKALQHKVLRKISETQELLY